MQFFVKESAFEQALVDHLPHQGWESNVIVQPTEDDLVKNWAAIIYGNNRDISRLGNTPLTGSEMRQIIDQVNRCDSPYAVNKLINGMPEITRSGQVMDLPDALSKSLKTLNIARRYSKRL